MMTTAVRGEGDQALREPRCARCKALLPPQKYNGPPRKFCSRECRDKATYERRRDAERAVRGEGDQALRDRRKRRPLPDVTKEAAWSLRRDVERIERIFADDRFAQNEEQVTAQLRGHLAYAAEVCHDLLSRIPSPTGE